ncbi:hypothetical protein AAVH_04199 [Aphelenchoides avenae]|nr:hypothetical protein AAVH_04199 [Aphelenchus avenae]
MSYDKKEKIKKDYSYEDHVRCGFGVGGTFGWLVPLLLFNALDVVNAFRVKSVCWFRVSGVIWAIGFVLDTITLLAVTVVLLFSGLIILFFTFVSMFLGLLWVFSFPAIVLLGFYVYALFKAAQIYDYERRNAQNVAAPT